MLRALVERMVRGMVLRRKLPSDFRSQTIYVSPDARLSYLFRSVGRTDHQLLEWVRERVKPGEIVWDIGSNCGVFGIAAAVTAGASGGVLAVEPDPFLAGLLRRSRERLESSHARFDIAEVAVAEQPGRGVLHVAARGRAANWLAGSRPSTQARGKRFEVDVPVVTLDLLLVDHSRPTLVKIDAEGSEGRILSGARRLLREVRPTLLIEVSATADEIASCLHENGYQLFDAELSPGDRRPLESPALNTLAIPSTAGAA
jgi:FkbM family methyltransferase